MGWILKQIQSQQNSLYCTLASLFSKIIGWNGYRDYHAGHLDGNYKDYHQFITTMLSYWYYRQQNNSTTYFSSWKPEYFWLCFVLYAPGSVTFAFFGIWRALFLQNAMVVRDSKESNFFLHLMTTPSWYNVNAGFKYLHYLIIFASIFHHPAPTDSFESLKL